MAQAVGYDSSGYTTTVCENEGTVSRQGVYTKLVSIEGGCSGFVALVKPDTDFDDRFKCFDIDNNEWLWVNGWSCDIEAYDPEEAAREESLARGEAGQITYYNGERYEV